MPPSTPMPARWHATVANGAAFALPALSLVLPSGYSWGALLLCVSALMVVVSSPARAWPRGALAAWCLSVLLMGGLYASDAWLAAPWHWNALDKPLKFALAALAAFAVTQKAPSPTALKWGIWLGALGAGLTAAWQLHVVDWERAWGHTNAIQFGDIALLLSVWSAAWARAERSRWRWLGWLACAAGGYACLASASRGAWLTAPVLPLLLVWPFLSARQQPPSPLAGPRASAAQRSRAWVGMATGVALAAVLMWPTVHTRLELATQEIAQFNATGTADNSVGQRLAHWQLAAHLGMEKPWTGWGEQGYQIEKKRWVDAGQAPAALLSFSHAHNDWLDLWAKKGVAGVLALLLLMGVPATIYWRTLTAPASANDTNSGSFDTRTIAARCGLILVVGYLGFGQTQVMFAHNSGTMVYLFMNLLFLSVCEPSRPIHTPREPLG